MASDGVGNKRSREGAFEHPHWGKFSPMIAPSCLGDDGVAVNTDFSLRSSGLGLRVSDLQVIVGKAYKSFHNPLLAGDTIPSDLVRRANRTALPPTYEVGSRGSAQRLCSSFLIASDISRAKD